MDIEKNVIRAYALENALKYKGKASQGAVLAGLFSEGLKKEDIKEVISQVGEVIDEVNSMTLKKQEKEFEKLKVKVHKREIREGLPALENAEDGKVVMRFAPFPSGPLHIGNTRQLILNDEYVKMYDGKLILVMDDTIGSEEKPIEPEAYALIQEGVDWLGVNYDKKIVYKSDRLEKYYAYAEELIKKGYMYVCDCSQKERHELRKRGVGCGCRELSASEHVIRWKEMFEPETKEGSLAVRLKTNMQDPDPAFRDRVMFRISDRRHPRLNRKYRVYPLLEFSWAIDDHLLGVTHILRGVDLMMETRVEKFIWDIFQWEHLTVIHTGFFSIQGIRLSKSKGAKEVKAGEYSGWNDPRTWSLQSLRDRGIAPEIIRSFILNMGLTKVNSTIAVDVLYALNKKFLEDKVTKRYFFVPEPVKIHIAGTPELSARLPLHPSQNLGFRDYKTGQDFFVPKQDFSLMKNGDYRLMHLLNFRAEEIGTVRPRDFSFISEEPEDGLDVKFIQWLPADAGNVKVSVRMADNSVVEGLGEAELKKLKVGDVVQFERFGFVKLYKKGKVRLEFWFGHF
ncbi:glutamate--tRNA ligase [Candidatus Pacearchaeota archaeon]|nr:glutamate--tRNA ligase [Candidatus Pacearchaeota archaeon]|tara:strand:+ start:912 stop:2609 length:1698 start_codon:yes stop_codon:yes gene_type:complete